MPLIKREVEAIKKSLY